jgi:hypothetical protein
MALSNAERQQRWRARRNALAKQSPSEVMRRLRDLDKRKLSADERARLAKELSELAAAYRQYAAAMMRVARGLRS